MLKIRMLRTHADFRAGAVYDVPETPGEMWIAHGLAERVSDPLSEAVSEIAPDLPVIPEPVKKKPAAPTKGKAH